MKLNDKLKALLVLVGIIAAFAGCIYLIVTEVLISFSLLFVAFFCYPWARYVWRIAMIELNNPIRILKRSLPKCGFDIDNEEWNDEKNVMRITGKFRDDNFAIHASTNSAYLVIFDLPWLSVKADDASVPKLMEAVNDTNAQSLNACVVVGEPDENNVRQIYTASNTVLPNYNACAYLDSLMCSMLNCKRMLADNLQKERPWMNKQRRNPIGFNHSNANKEDA